MLSRADPFDEILFYFTKIIVWKNPYLEIEVSWAEFLGDGLGETAQRLQEDTARQTKNVRLAFV